MRAVIYTRVSSKDQVANLSLPTQEKACREWCERAGAEVSRVFIESGESAKTANRPALSQALEFCRTNRVEFFVVYNVTRFARSTHDHAIIAARLKSYGATLRSVTEPIDDSSTGRLMETVLAGIAQFDNDVRGERTLAGMKAAAERGRWTHRAPLGYVNAHGSPSLVLDPERAPTVRQAFEEAASGSYSRESLRRRLGELGLITRSGHPVPRQTFAGMLRNPIYAGRIRTAAGVDVDGDFVPIVSRDLFDQVQAFLLGRAPSFSARSKGKPDLVVLFPLRHFVRCGKCDRPLTGSRSRGGSGAAHAYYHCLTQGCGARATKLELERQFEVLLDSVALSDDALEALRFLVRGEWEKSRAYLAQAQKAKRAALASIADRRAKLDDAFVYRQAIDRETYKAMLDRLEDERALATCDSIDNEIELAEVEALLDFAERLVCRPARAWAEFTYENRRAFQKVIFPEGLRWSRDRGFMEPRISPVFNHLRASAGSKAGMVAHTGIEPVFRP